MVRNDAPQLDFLPPGENGIWRIPRSEVSIGGKMASSMDIVAASLKSKSKERAGVPSGDQILCAWLTPSKLVVGVADGIMPVPG